MAMIKVVGLSKAFGSETIFKNVTFTVAEGQRVGLVGRNGAGKSTLLRCVMGTLEADSGSVSVTDQATIGYVQQSIDFGAPTLREVVETAWEDVRRIEHELEDLTKRMGRTSDPALLERYAKLEDRFERLGGYAYETMTRRIMIGLGFTEADWDRAANDFSGGQKTRINLARALVRRPDFLLLDEPTNHLDIAMTEWLEDFLRSYRGGILLVSHDRYFLDAVTTDILDLEQHQVTSYRGNYSAFSKKKSARFYADLRAYEKQQEEIAQTEAYIRKYKAGIKAKQARGRQSQLNRLERLQKPVTETTLAFSFRPATGTAERVLDVQELAAAYGDRTIFKDISFLLRRGDTVGIIGPNGIGKSTLLSVITGEKTPAHGTVTFGNRVALGYYSQEHTNLHPNRTVLEEVMQEYGCGEDDARHILGGFLFRGDDVYRLVGQLSGGEQARLALLLLLLEEPNVLILDEPTNHLDIPTREMIEDALLEFGGTYLVVSHDRYLLDRLVQRTLSFEDGTFREYLGNYSYWKEKRKELLETGRIPTAETPAPRKKENTATAPASDVSPAPPPPRATDSFRAAPQAAKKIAALEQEIARTEATITMIETQIAQTVDADELTELAESLSAAQEKLTTQYEKWEHWAQMLD